MTEEYQRQRLALLDAGATLCVGGRGTTHWAEARFKREPSPEVREIARAAGYVVVIEREQGK